jgi:hypothetical protein
VLDVHVCAGEAQLAVCLTCMYACQGVCARPMRSVFVRVSSLYKLLYACAVLTERAADHLAEHEDDMPVSKAAHLLIHLALVPEVRSEKRCNGG